MAVQALGVASLPAPRIRVRRNVRWLTIGALAVVLGGLGSWALFNQVADARPALKVSHTIYRGQILQASDLSVISIGRSVDLPVVSADELGSVVGQAAKSDLPEGSLLVKNSYGSAGLAAGLARVGLKVDAGRIPSTTLKPGTLVQVVALPPPTSSGAAPALPASIDATLTGTPVAAADGSFAVDLNVPQASAEQVARLGALKQVVIIQKAEA